MNKGIVFLLSGVCLLLFASFVYAACECTVCHGDMHGAGWKGCTSCHGNPPVVSAVSGTDGLVRFPSPTGSATAGAHEKHATPAGMNYTCGVCHYQGMPDTPIAGNYKIQIGLGGGAYDGQALNSSYSYEGTNGTTITTNGSRTCSTIYCHSAGTGGTSNSSVSPPVNDVRPVASGSSPSWEGSFPMACSNWTGQSCSTNGCHYTLGLLINPDQTYNNECRSCVHCHGSPIPSGFTKSSYPSSPHKCYGCHNYPPNYEQDHPKSNSHSLHSYVASCNACHFTTTSDGMTVTDPSKHGNGVYDVAPDPSALYSTTPVNFTYTYDIGGGTCSNISCHQARGIGTGERWGSVWINIGRAWGSGPNCYEIIFYNVSASGGTPPYTYFWDFGDGTTSTEQNPTHIYPSGATYYGTVYARDVNNHLGVSGVWPTPQSVNTAPVANFAVSVFGWTVTLTDLSYDTDYNLCGHSGSGHIEIMWPDYSRTNETINLTDQPSNKVYTHTFAPANYGQSAYIFDIIRDNSSVQSQKATPVSIPTTYAIGGRVANAAGVGLKDALVYLRTMSGGVPSVGTQVVYTDANGYYTIAGTAVDGECYLVKQPIKYGYTFTPGDQTVCGANANVNWLSSP